MSNLDDHVFDRVTSFIWSASGIRLTRAKKIMVEGRLQRRARALGLHNINEYCRLVFDTRDFEDEAVNLIDAMTTNKTDFFREQEHFDFLIKTAVPELAMAGRPAKLWSAACSIGAEPYSLAMVLNDFIRDRLGWSFSILASDISTDALAKAVRAVFPLDMIDPVPKDMRQRYLLRHNDLSKPVFRIGPEVRALVRFARINLINDHYPVDRDMDVILCRNLLIYFDKQTQKKVVDRLCSHLRPGGYLILGHTDSLAGMTVPLDWLGNSIFRRRTA